MPSDVAAVRLLEQCFCHRAAVLRAVMQLCSGTADAVFAESCRIWAEFGICRCSRAGSG